MGAGSWVRRLALLLFFHLVCSPVPILAAEPSEFDVFPLRPPNTSSPRDTLRGFLEATEAVRKGFLDNDMQRVRSARRRAAAALDFSETTNGSFWDERSRRVMYLREILDRVELPAFDAVPGDADVRDGDVASWTVPDTQLVISRVAAGERVGQYLFSATTVARLHRDYRRVRHLPYRPGVEGGFLELVTAAFDAKGTIASRIRQKLKPVEATSPRVVLVEFLRSVNEAYAIVNSVDASTTSRSEAREANRQADRLMGRAMRMLDLSQVAEALRGDVGTEAALFLKEVLDRAPLPTIGSVPGERTIALSEGPFVRWVFPNTEIEIVPLPEAPGQFGFSAATVDRAEEFYERVRQLPYRGRGAGPNETRFEDEYPDAAVSPGFYEYYIRTPGSLVPGAYWIGPLVGMLPDSMNALVLGQTVWQWLTLLISLVLLGGVLTAIFVGAGALGRRTGPARAQWLRLVPPLAAASLVSRYAAFLDGTVNLTGVVNRTSLVVGTALVYLFVAFAVFRIVVAVAETLASWLRRGGGDGESDEPDRDAVRFDTSLLRVVATSLGFIAAVVVFVTGVRQLGVDVVPLLAGLGVGGLAVALAVRPTLENMIGGVILYADRPVYVGDYCSFGDQKGIVERIGLRSTRIRALDRTIITVPNSVFADMQIINWASCDKMLITTVIGLRYETTPEQLRRVLASMRQICFAHPKIETDTLRVRFAGFGASSLDLKVRVYALVTDWNEFFAVREDLFMRFMDVIEESGTAVAFPSTTLYLTKDEGLDAERAAQAEREVAGWRDAGELPFPRTPEPLATRIADSLDYPPKGSPEAGDA